MKRVFGYIFSFSFISLLLSKQALAICPICTIAVAGGLEISHLLGIDDSVSGLWIGGLIVSFIFWNIDWFKRKNIDFPGKNIITIVGWYALTIAPLYFTKMAVFSLTNNLNIGIIVGSVAFWSAADWHFYLKQKNNDKVYFPFQKVAIPVGTLFILSIVFYFLTR